MESAVKKIGLYRVTKSPDIFTRGRRMWKVPFFVKPHFSRLKRTRHDRTFGSSGAERRRRWEERSAKEAELPLFPPGSCNFRGNFGGDVDVPGFKEVVCRGYPRDICTGGIIQLKCDVGRARARHNFGAGVPAFEYIRPVL